MTRHINLLCLSVVVISLTLIDEVRADNNSEAPPIYEVNRLGMDIPAPMIDGVVSGEEWSTASVAAGDWVDLLTAKPDSHNLRFRMLWDSEHLYVLGETDFTGFGSPLDDFDDPSFAGQAYAPSMFFDPNKDGEDISDTRAADALDGYQISWNIQEGFSSRMPTRNDADRALRSPFVDGVVANDYVSGFFLQSHVNSTTGNAGGWNKSNEGPNQNYRDDTHPGLVFAQNADNDNLNGTGAGGGVWEWAIDWSEFNATDPSRLLTESDGDLILEEIPNPFDPSNNMPNPNYLGEPGDPDPRYADTASKLFLENGLFAVEPPNEGDAWAFELGANTPDRRNATPSWSEPMGGDETRVSFAAWGNSAHGQIIFKGAPAPVGMLDCNGDGVVTGDDLTCVTPETIDDMIDALMILLGDLDADGKVAFSDFLIMSTNFTKTDVGYTGGDIDFDGKVAFGDFLVLSTNFGKSSAAPEVAGVPEPNSLLLLLMGSLLVRRRRKRTSAVIMSPCRDHT